MNLRGGTRGGSNQRGSSHGFIRGGLNNRGSSTEKSGRTNVSGGRGGSFYNNRGNSRCNVFGQNQGPSSAVEVNSIGMVIQ